MPFSIVLFDLDGTLADTNGLIVATFQHIFKTELGLDVPAEQIHRHFGEPLPASFARYDEKRADYLVDRYRTWNVAHHDELIRQFPGVTEMVADLKAAGLRLGVVTSKKHDMAIKGLRACGLESYFEVLVGMDETTRHKPEPDPIFLALDRLGAMPGDHVIMVGDSAFDMLCGRNAGVKTAAVGWTVINRDELAATHPDHWVDTPADLRRLILG